MSLVACAIALWIAGYGFALIVGQTAGYAKQTNRILSVAWNRHWKFFVGLLVGVALGGAA